MSESERPLPDRATSSETCGRCREPLDASMHALMLCETCLGRHHAGCWTDGCAACGESRGLGPIGPLAHVSAPAGVVAGIGPRPTRVRRRPVAVVALVALGVMVAFARASADALEVAPKAPVYPDVIWYSGFDGIPELQRAAYARSLELDHAGAVAAWAAYVARAPWDGNGWCSLGYEHGAVGDYVAALSDCTRAIELNPREAYAWNNRGYARTHLGDFAGARTDIEHSLELDPKNEYAWENRGNLRLMQGDHEGAIADFEQALAVDRRHVRTDAIREALRRAREGR